MSLFKRDRINFLPITNSDREFYKRSYMVYRNISASNLNNIWVIYKNERTKMIHFDLKKRFAIYPNGKIELRQ